MQPKPTVVAVCGSMRDGSHTRTALKHVLDAAAEAGAETELIDVREYDLPIFDPDEEMPEDAEEITRKIREADSVVLGSPVYHGSYTSAFRNVHDYCSFDEFEDTTVGLLAVAGGGSYGSTLDHMRITVRGVHGWVLPHQVGIRKAYDQFENGEFKDEDLEERTRKLGEQAAKYAFITPDVTSAEADETEAGEAAADD
ncbi:NADPH-dependent FMN reductase [Haladaptatus paucihalophilus]|uniref:NAD(P)H-dependent FMN reductase n=2 Tax=Haladaptatus paucihalophilus DX253 TaxID=797209 RepID=A0A1M7B261_HALPU|nr:NAD(P)H-dependent oxidoreductase [Haladaptatus paucihalophilus]SHL49034.1 NAD(P)H-dependent FMN reductase [Haladaptatus paucihalophilus DX253]